MAFPDDRLEQRTRLAFGADVTADPGTWTWTDVSADVPAQDITISRGRSAEAGAVTPGSISLMFDNPNGDYTPELATGAHYPNIVQGVPLQESLRGSTTFLDLPGTGARISTPTSSDLEFTGDFDLRCDVTLTQWRVAGRQVALMSKAGAGTAQSWEIGVTGDGQFYVVWRESSTSTVELWPNQLLVIPPSGRLAVRAAVDVDDGSGGLVAYFWTAPTLDDTWVPLGDPVPLAGASALFPCTADIEVGDLTHPMLSGDTVPVGRLHGLEVRDGIDGTVVAKITAADIEENAVTFTGDDGRTWTVTAPAEATRWYPRITAAATRWLPTWPYGDLSNPDRDYPGESRVTVNASGLLQRMGQGNSPLQSTLRRRIPSDPDILAYWPMEDGAASTQAASGLPGGRPAAVTGVTWASDSTLPGSDALPSTGTSATLTATVPAPTGTPDGWRTEFVYRCDTGPASASDVMDIRLTGGLISQVRISLLASTFTVTLSFTDPSQPDDVSTIPAANTLNTWNRLAFYATQVTATTMSVHFAVITIGGDAYTFDSTARTGKIGRITSLNCTYGNAIQGLRIGHLAAFATDQTGIFNAADTGFDGERAADRAIRLCGEENMPLLVAGDTAQSAPMGPQPLASLLTLLQECADTDGGILGEQTARLALRLRTRTSLYNQDAAITLDAAVNEITNPFAPALDDQGLRNMITAQRSGGSSATVSDADSIARSGLYDSQVPVNPETDGQLPDIAAWQVHLGTAKGMRYPQISMDLGTAPQLIDAWLMVDSGDLAKVTGLPPQHPSDTVTALAQGYTETFSPTAWTATANCTPGAPWTIGIVGDDRADTDGSELATGVDADDTTLSITVTAGPRWTTDPDQYPVDLLLGGEVVTATDCTGTSNPQTMTVIRGVNGVVRSWDAGTDIRLANPMITSL
jgi:hypothetical protein